MKFPDEVYTPTAVERGLITLEDAIKEISRLRKNSRERLVRLANRMPKHAERATNVVMNLPYVAEVKAAANPDRAAGIALAHLYAVQNDYMMSITGINEHIKKTLEGLHRSGYTWVTKENLDDFTSFMDWSRAILSSKFYDSKRVAKWLRDNRAKYQKTEDLEKAFQEWMKEDNRKRRVRVDYS